MLGQADIQPQEEPLSENEASPPSGGQNEEALLNTGIVSSAACPPERGGQVFP